MPNLVDIPTVVGTLVTLAASGGTDAAVEAIKGITVNGALKLADLRDDLFSRDTIAPVVHQVGQNPLDPALKSQLEEMLADSLKQHPVFANQTNVDFSGDVKADNGAVAAGVNTGKITVSNTANSNNIDD